MTEDDVSVLLQFELYALAQQGRLLPSVPELQNIVPPSRLHSVFETAVIKNGRGSAVKQADSQLSKMTIRAEWLRVMDCAPTKYIKIYDVSFLELEDFMELTDVDSLERTVRRLNMNMGANKMSQEKENLLTMEKESCEHPWKRQLQYSSREKRLAPHQHDRTGAVYLAYGSRPCNYYFSHQLLL